MWIYLHLKICPKIAVTNSSRVSNILILKNFQRKTNPQKQTNKKTRRVALFHIFTNLTMSSLRENSWILIPASAFGLLWYYTSYSLLKIPPYTQRKKKKGCKWKKSNDIFFYYENSFDLADPPKMSQGPPEFPGSHFENRRIKGLAVWPSPALQQGLFRFSELLPVPRYLVRYLPEILERAQVRQSGLLRMNK